MKQTIESALMDGRLASHKEVMPVEVYQALSLMIAFATLVVLIIANKRK